jgi:uncharacterized damage-inducible protein DinB
MRLADVRLLFAYDRWATRRLLNSAEDVSAEVWARPAAIGERGLGGILVHALGAHGRWRSGWMGLVEKPRPELEPLPSPTKLRAWWGAEWAALDAWLDGLPDDATEEIWDGLPLWQTMAHVVNHGTQHRSEAAALLTEAGLTPGDLDLIDYLEDTGGDD